LTITLYDQSLTPIHNVTTADQYQGSVSNRTSFDQEFLNSLDSLNIYTLSYNRTHYVTVSRFIQKLISNPWLSYLGISPSYVVDPYIQTLFRSVAITDAEYDPTVYATVYLTAQSFRTSVQQEIKDKTLLSLLALMGGLFGTATATYYFLFGDGKLSPWGFIQNYGCCLSVATRKELREHFKVAGNGSYQPITSTSQNNELDDILKDYVVDMRYLDRAMNERIGDINKGDT